MDNENLSLVFTLRIGEHPSWSSSHISIVSICQSYVRLKIPIFLKRQSNASSFLGLFYLTKKCNGLVQIEFEMFNIPTFVFHLICCLFGVERPKLCHKLNPLGCVGLKLIVKGWSRMDQRGQVSIERVIKKRINQCFSFCSVVAWHSKTSSRIQWPTKRCKPPTNAFQSGCGNRVRLLNTISKSSLPFWTYPSWEKTTDEVMETFPGGNEPLLSPSLLRRVLFHEALD